MRRSAVGLAEIAWWDNLARAFHRAALGRRCRRDVEAFRAGLDGELTRLHADLVGGSVEVGRMRSFTIRYPKLRTIHAPCFRERVLHHANMAYVGPVLDRGLVADGRQGAAERVVRGGSWNNKVRNVRAAYRNGNEPEDRNDNLGFRCAQAHARIGPFVPEQAASRGVAGPESALAETRKAAGVLVAAQGLAANARRPADATNA